MKGTEFQELAYVEPLIERLVKEYRVAHNYPWFVAFSNGKDSTALLYVVWRALERIPVEERKRQVIVATSDTLLEHPSLKEMMGVSVEAIQRRAEEEGLPITARLVQPKMTAMMKMLGKGNPLPAAKGRVNRWCTSYLKIQPMEEYQKEWIAQYGAVILLLGTRHEESVKRSATMKKQRTDSSFVFPMKGSGAKTTGLPDKYVAYPVEELTTEEVWRMITHVRKLPWGTRATQIRAMYEGAGECPVQVDKSIGKPCGGSSRNGCMLCMMSGGLEDKMLQTFIEKEEKWAAPVQRLRRLIRESLYDIRLRRPVNWYREKMLDEVNPFLESYEDKKAFRSEYAVSKGKSKREKYERYQQDVQRAFSSMSESVIPKSHPVYPYMAVGGYHLWARIWLYKAVRATEEVSGITFLQPHEVEYIKQCWMEEGWDGNEQDLMPEFPEYEGSLVLHEDYSVNVIDDFQATTIPNLTIYETEYSLKSSESICPLPIYVKKQYPPKRKQPKMTKLEWVAIMNRFQPKTINWTPRSKERHQLFYIPFEWGGTERSIRDHLQRSSIKTRSFLPYYWMPSYDVERGVKGDAVCVYWNTVYFIVCDPSIQTRQQAIAHVEWYVAAGEVAPIEREMASVVSGKTIREVLLHGEEWEYLSDAQRDAIPWAWTQIARTMRYYANQPERVARWCQGEDWYRVCWIMFEGDTTFEAWQRIVRQGYSESVLPEAFIRYLGIPKSLFGAMAQLKKQGIGGRKRWEFLPMSIIRQIEKQQTRNRILTQEDWAACQRKQQALSRQLELFG